MSSVRRRRSILLASAAAMVLLVLLVIALWQWPGHLLRGAGSGAPRPASTFTPVVIAGGPVPQGAAETVRRLVSGTPEQQRSALTPELNSALGAGQPFPSGARLTLDVDGWHQNGVYANAVGSLSLPGQADERVEIGFVDRSGAWLVTFEEVLP